MSDEHTCQADRRPGIVAIAGSAGGVDALIAVLKALPASFPLPVVAAVHLPPRARYNSRLPDVLNHRIALTARWAEDGQLPRAGCVHVAPQDATTTLDDNGLMSVVPLRPRLMCPRADPLFESVARQHGRQSIVVVLSGALSDGAGGADAIEAAGGVVIAQDRATAFCFSMPDATIRRGAAHHVMPLRCIPSVVIALAMAAGARAWLNVERDSLYQIAGRAAAA